MVRDVKHGFITGWIQLKHHPKAGGAAATSSAIEIAVRVQNQLSLRGISTVRTTREVVHNGLFPSRIQLEHRSAIGQEGATALWLCGKTPVEIGNSGLGEQIHSCGMEFP
jgi:hypothetical protein